MILKKIRLFVNPFALFSLSSGSRFHQRPGQNLRILVQGHHPACEKSGTHSTIGSCLEIGHVADASFFQVIQETSHIWKPRGHKLLRTACTRMGQSQPFCMKCLTRKTDEARHSRVPSLRTPLILPTIDPISNQWKTLISQVNPDLMGTPGLGSKP